jgi:streptogramin lyase
VIPAAAVVRVEAQVAVDRQPGSPAYGFGSVWVPSSEDGIVDRVDPKTMKVIARIRTGPAAAIPQNQYYDSVAISPGAIWHASDAGHRLDRIDPRTNRVVKTIALPGRPDEVAAGPQGVYVSLFQEPLVLRIDPRTNTVAQRRSIGGSAMGVAYGAGSVWALSTTGPTVVRLDPSTLAVRGRTSVNSTSAVGNGYFDAWWISADASGVCVLNQQQNLVSRLDAHTGKLAAQTALGFGANPFGVAADGSTCWAVNTSGAFAVQGSTVTSTRLPSAGPSAFVGIAAGGGHAWVTGAGRNRLYRIAH